MNTNSDSLILNQKTAIFTALPQLMLIVAISNSAAGNNVMFISGLMDAPQTQGPGIGIIFEQDSTYADILHNSHYPTKYSFNLTKLNITGKTHYITSPFSTGNLTVYSPPSSGEYWVGNLPSGAQMLAEMAGASSWKEIVAIDDSAKLFNFNTAPNERRSIMRQPTRDRYPFSQQNINLEVKHYV